MSYMANTQNTITAECGCTRTGRVYSAAKCTKLDLATATGTQMSQHALKATRWGK